MVVVEGEVVGVVLLGLHVLEGGGGRGQRRRCERWWQRRERCEGGHGGGQRGGRGLWVSMGEVMVLVVQVVVVVLGEVVSVLDVRAPAVHVVHVHDVRLAVLGVVVEDGGQVGDG